MKFRQIIKKYLIPLFGIFILYQTRHYIKDSVARVFYLNIKETKSTTGHIIYIERNDGDALSFEYTVKYKVGDKFFKFKELLSPDSLIIPIDSTVAVRYSTFNHSVATMRGKGRQYKELGISVLIIGMVLIMVTNIFSDKKES